MWLYEKKLEYPVKIKRPNPALAKFIISQVGGPDGEMGAATRYLQQRYSMPYAQVKGMLTDIGTEELARSLYQCNVNVAERRPAVEVYTMRISIRLAGTRVPPAPRRGFQSRPRSDLRCRIRPR